jgi:hypothetical protein
MDGNTPEPQRASTPTLEGLTASAGGCKGQARIALSSPQGRPQHLYYYATHFGTRHHHHGKGGLDVEPLRETLWKFNGERSATMASKTRVKTMFWFTPSPV